MGSGRRTEREAREIDAGTGQAQAEAARVAQVGRGKALEVACGRLEGRARPGDLEGEAEGTVAQRSRALDYVDELDAEVGEDVGAEAEGGRPGADPGLGTRSRRRGEGDAEREGKGARRAPSGAAR